MGKFGSFLAIVFAIILMYHSPPAAEAQAMNFTISEGTILSRADSPACPNTDFVVYAVLTESRQTVSTAHAAMKTLQTRTDRKGAERRFLLDVKLT